MPKYYADACRALLVIGIACFTMSRANAQLSIEPNDDSLVPILESIAPNLRPERVSGTIVDVAVATPSLSTLVAALSATNLVSTLQGPGPFTVFAPTNTAFANIPPAILNYLLANPSQLKTVLLYHVAAGIKDLGFAVEPKVVKTVQGENVFGRIVFQKDDVTLKINNSTVVIRPIRVDNGLIYVIDSVLQPQF